MPNFSSIVVCGHIGRDASTKPIGNNSVTEFSVAVTHKVKGEKVTTWYRCTLWGSRGEKLAPSLTKGQAVIVSGSLEPREYKGKNDELRTSLDIRVDQLGFAGNGGGDRVGASPAYQAPAKSTAGYDEASEVPF